MNDEPETRCEYTVYVHGDPVLDRADRDQARACATSWMSHPHFGAATDHIRVEHQTVTRGPITSVNVQALNLGVET